MNLLKNIFVFLTILGVVVFYTPYQAKAANTFHLNCTTDGAWHGLPADDHCDAVTTSQWDIGGTGNNSWSSTNSILQGGTTWASFTLTSSGTIRLGDHSSSNDQLFTSSQTNVSLGTQQAGTFTIYGPGPGSNNITAMCVTDTSGGCEGGGTTATPIPNKALLQARWIW